MLTGENQGCRRPNCSWIVICFIAAATALLCQPLFAATVKMSGSQVGTIGGPFIATVTSGPVGIYPTGETFATFCVERGENFSPNTNYWAVVSDRARFGTNGTSGTDQYGTYDLLDPHTAYLYSNYMKGTMTSVAGTWTGSDGDLIALQDAIWQIEGEGNINTGGATAGLKSSLLTAATTAAWTGIGNVRVMQLWKSQASVNTTAGKVQDQLVLVPTPTASLAGLGLAMGLVTVAWSRQRKGMGDLA